jgi:VanZ family protein
LTVSAARWLLICRVGFWLYALTLFTATHWPSLKIEGSGRPDIWVHLAAFALWTGALIAAAFFGPILSRRNIALAAITAIVYAALDESTQAIPFLHRTAAFDDWLADLTGIAMATTAATCVALLRRRLNTNPSLPSPPS